MRVAIAFTFALSALVAGMPAAAQVEIKEVATRPGVTLRFGYFPAAQPVAAAVLFQGGSGDVGLFANGSTRNGGFLATGAERFNQNQISVAIVDLPSDRRTLDNFRNTQAHADDIAPVIEFLRQRTKLPVWAIGTSNGSLSAATSATLLKGRGPDGVVFTAAVTRNPVEAAHPVTAAALEDITLPALFVHHRNDGCMATPFDGIPAAMKRLGAARPVELIAVEGGSSTGNPCRTGHHQFLGIEADVTRQIADWIKRALPAAPARPAN